MSQEPEHEFKVSITSEQMDEALDQIRSGAGTAKADELRRRLTASRATVLGILGRKDNPPSRVTVLAEILWENRASQDELARRIQAISDERHAQRMVALTEASNSISRTAATHSAQMIDLAKASNSIAGNANETAKALKQWTVVLAVATIVLALATLALIGATVAAPFLANE